MRFLVLSALLAMVGCSHGRLAKSVAPAAAPAVEKATDSAEWYLKRRLSEGMTEFPADRYTAAVEQVARMPRYSAQQKRAERVDAPAAATTHSWIPLGPGNIGGRTRSFVINPQNANIMYVGAVTGGVFKSTDGGATWNVLTDGLPTLTVGALALDPNNSSVIYAGTGEAWDGRPGLGIYKSSDAGATWTLLGAPTTFGAFQYINRIAVSKNNSQRIYAATHNGLYSSKDGGQTWTSSGINASYYGCTDMAIRTDQPTDYLFATCSGSSASQTTAVYRNTDAAGSGAWSSVFTTANMGTSVIAIAPSQPSTIYLGAAAGTRDTVSLVGVYRSTANGDSGSWVQQASGSDPNPFVQLLFSYAGNAASYCSSGGTFNGATGGSWSRVMAVDPLDPNRVWLGGADLSRSDDGGVTWGVASRWDISGPYFSHADRHLLVFHPGYDGVTNQTIFQMTDSGMFRSDNARAAVSTGTRAGCTTEYQNADKLVWSRIDKSYVSMQFYHGVAYSGGASYMGGAQDNGTNRGTDGGGLNAWGNLFGGDGGAVAVDPADGNRLMLSAQNLSLFRLTNGVTLISAQSGITEPAASFPFIAYLAADPNNGMNLFFGGTTTLWRSTNQAVSWTAAAPVEKSSSVSAITVSPFDSNTVFFGTAQGYIYSNTAALTSNGTATWTSTRPRSGNVASIAFDPTNPNIMYATYSTFKSAGQAHVYRSTDAGQTWTGIDGSGSSAVPDAGIWRILVDPLTPSTLYLGSDIGLLVSPDSGSTWTFDSGLPAVYVEDLNIDPTNNWLFAFTFGRGVYKTPLTSSTPLNCTYAVTPTSIAADTAGGQYPVTVTAPAGCAWVGLPGATPSRFAVQSPAQGIGSGSAVVVVPANLSGAGSDAVTIAGQRVAITQPAATLLNVGSDLVGTATTLTIPSTVRRSASGLTSTASDPVHSCTKSSDANSIWWQVTPSVSGILSVQARGDRTDVFGDLGMVVTAYAQKTPTAELACAFAARDTTANTFFGFKIPVTAGTTYLIEAATTTVISTGNYNLIVSMATPDPTVSIAPVTASVVPGTGTQQFTAQVTNTANAGVRWTLSSPTGVVSAAGKYAAPVSAASPTLVGLTATSLADPAKSATGMVTVVPAATTSLSIVVPVAGVVNAASFKSPATVAPGEMITIFGTGFGPLPIAGLTLGPNNFVSTISGSTLVLFDGVAAPMVYSVTGQVSAVVPYAVAGKSSTLLQIYYNGLISSSVTVPVVASAPGLFTLNAQGFGPLAMFNQNGSVNSAGNPAAAGEVIVIYGTGEGQTIPAGVDGLLAIASLPKPALQVSATIGGLPAAIDYFGAAPGFASGLFQANLHVPAGIPPGSAVPVVVTVGTASSSTAATMAVK